MQIKFIPHLEFKHHPQINAIRQPLPKMFQEYDSRCSWTS